jgi:formylglycine-generating enzyme required for sulfatase activity
LDSVGWYGAYATPVGNSAKTTNKVGGKQPNAFGLSDMSGNVWEWVEDSYHDTYAGAPTNGSAWQGDGAKRVLRGGSWYFEPRFARAADRDGDRPALRDSFVGFRLARMLP